MLDNVVVTLSPLEWGLVLGILLVAGRSLYVLGRSRKSEHNE